MVLRPVYSDMSLATIDAFHELPENSVDLIVYGSSHSWRGINTKELTDDFGIQSYNYSCMWQHINTTDLFVHDSLRTQKPKIAVIDMGNIDAILRDTEIVGEVYYTRKIKHSDAKKRYLRECFGNDYGRYASYYLPLSMYHAGWTDITAASFDKSGLQPKSYIESRGYLGFDSCESVSVSDGSEYWENPLPDESVRVLDDMVEALSREGAKVILVTVPYYSNEFIYRDALKQYALDKGCAYLDFFELSSQIGLNGDTDFSEWDHLNNSGAHKVTEYLGEYIRENYEL